MSDARLKAMAKLLIQADNSDDPDWLFELLKSSKKLDHETRARLQEIINDLYRLKNND